MSVSPKLSTFKGVFTPTIVTIMGVIMYLRQGWLVGNGGLLGAWLVLAICLCITSMTALSLSSIATNVRLHAGGAYSIVSRSLGLETGGVVGFMLYIAQSLAITMYIFGFREGWLGIFPTHEPLLIDLGCFVAMVTIVRFYMDLAFQLQYFIFAITILSVASVSWKPFDTYSYEINWIGNFGGRYENFWTVLSVYFPAVTGILAGASLSGDLEDPRESIPKGTMWAVGVSGLIYAWLAIVYAGIPQATLLNNYNIMKEISLFPALISFAVLGATFCAGLATLVGAPKLAQALSKDGLLPKSRFIKRDHNGLWVTSLIVLSAILSRDLNSIAPVITICFLFTYGTINIIVLIEQQLGLISFRPSLRLPSWVPFIGALGCLFIALIVNSSITLLILCILMLGYIRLSRTPIKERQDARTNLFLAIARWAARKSLQNRVVEGKAWMPLPTVAIFENELKETPHQIVQLAVDMVSPSGSLRLLHLHNQERTWSLSNDIFIQESWLHSSLPQHAIETALQALDGTFLEPNILLIDDSQCQQFTDVDALMRQAVSLEMGLIYQLERPHTIVPDEWIHVWVRPQSPNWDVRIAQHEGSLDLALLVALRLAASHKLGIRLITTLEQTEEHEIAREYLETITVQGRLPSNTAAMAFVGTIWDGIERIPPGRIQIFGLPLSLENTEQTALSFVEKIRKHTSGTCLFIRGSGNENLLA